MVTFQRRAPAQRISEAPPREPVEAPPVPANVGYLFQIGHSEYIELAGVPLRVPPIPARDGALLYELRARIDAQRAASQAGQMAPEQFRDYTQAVARLERMLTRLVRPVRRRDKLRRFFGRWRPLRHATESELGGLLGFFLMLRAKSHIRFRSETAGRN